MGGFGDVLSKRGGGLLSEPDSCNSTGQPGQNPPKARAVQPVPQPQPLPERSKRHAKCLWKIRRLSGRVRVWRGRG